MRHYFVPGPAQNFVCPAQNCVRAISAAAGRMGETAVPARLIPPGNIPTSLVTGNTGTSFSAINLAPVAASADQHLRPTTLAQKEASGIMLICSMAVVMTWTRSPVCAIITWHSCSARCRARRRVELAVQSALCLPSSIFTKITAGAASVPVLTPSPETPPVYFSTRWPLTCLRAGKAGASQPHRTSTPKSLPKSLCRRLGTEYPHFSTTVHTHWC